MRSCERPRKRSASEALPSSVSNRYSLSIRTHGSFWRCRATLSLRRVRFFSASSSFFRAAIHSSRDATLCFRRRFFGSDFVAFVLMFSFLSFPCATSELVVLVFEQDIERRERTVTAGDILLQIELVGFAQFVAGVHLLLENSQIIPNHDDFVEECLERDFFRLKRTVGRLHDQGSALPSRGQTFYDHIFLFQSEC